MPIKYNLTKYDLLFSKIKKISAMKSPKEMSKDERSTMFQAVLVAAFSSSHSWQTYKILTSSMSGAFNTPETKKEYEEAFAAQWKRVSPFDINEVANANINGNVFSEWLFFNVPKETQGDLTNAWKSLQKEFNKDCDTAERIAYNR
jgi:signal peptidase I